MSSVLVALTPVLVAITLSVVFAMLMTMMLHESVVSHMSLLSGINKLSAFLMTWQNWSQIVCSRTKIT